MPKTSTQTSSQADLIYGAFWKNFLGAAPAWYKLAIISFLLINPFLSYWNPLISSWVLIAQFIFTLAMALKCYPLQPGGLLAIQAVLLGLTHPDTVIHEVLSNFKVILLLMFMVAGIYFMKNLLLFMFSKVLLNVRSKSLLSFIFCLTCAALSAFLDALTVTAVIITVATGFYSVYHRVVSGKEISQEDKQEGMSDSTVGEIHREDLYHFRRFLRSLMMHSAVGTALGGVCTTVGEPQNLIIADKAGWDFTEFFLQMAPITLPVLVAGLITCIALEKLKIFGYGAKLPDRVRNILSDYSKQEDAKRTTQDIAILWIQGFIALILVLSLAFHVAEIGLIGLMVIVLLTSFNGVIDEHEIGKAFEEAMPFTALLIVFFTIVSVIHDQHLFSPLIAMALKLPEPLQPQMFFVANGVLSAISDNVFVATIYINEIKAALDSGAFSLEHFHKLAIAINTGTNLPSVATPNGQAAFLFLLTSALAPLIRLSYGSMVWMALPYTCVLGGLGFLMIIITL